MNDIVDYAIGAAIALVLGSIYSVVKTAVRKRVVVRSPESAAIAKLVPVVNVILDMQGTQTEALITLLEVQKGICNGNVDKALLKTQASKAKYDELLLGAAKIEVEA